MIFLKLLLIIWCIISPYYHKIYSKLDWEINGERCHKCNRIMYYDFYNDEPQCYYDKEEY